MPQQQQAPQPQPLVAYDRETWAAVTTAPDGAPVLAQAGRSVGSTGAIQATSF